MSYPVPVYNLDGNRGSGWEMLAAMNGGMGGMNSWWPLLFLLFGWGGFGGYGWGGGFGGRGGGFGGGGCGCGCGGGFGAFADLAVTDATNIAELKAGTNFTAQTVNGISNRQYEQSLNQCNQFAGVNTNITTLGYQTQLGQRDLQAQIANCCCENQQSLCNLNNSFSQQFAQLNYNNAMQRCDLEKRIDAQGDRIVNLLQTQETDRLRGLLAKTEQENFMLKNCNNCG